MIGKHYGFTCRVYTSNDWMWLFCLRFWFCSNIIAYTTPPPSKSTNNKNPSIEHIMYTQNMNCYIFIGNKTDKYEFGFFDMRFRFWTRRLANENSHQKQKFFIYIPEMKSIFIRVWIGGNVRSFFFFFFFVGVDLVTSWWDMLMTVSRCFTMFGFDRLILAVATSLGGN